MHLNLFKPYLLSKENKKANPPFFSSYPCSGQCYYTLPNPLAPPYLSLNHCNLTSSPMLPWTVLEKVKDNFVATSNEYFLVPYLTWLLYTRILLTIPLFLKLCLLLMVFLLCLCLCWFSLKSPSSCPFLKCWCSHIPMGGYPLSPFLPFFWIFHLV